MPLKANYRFIDNHTTIFEIKKGVAKVYMNGKIKYRIDEDGDLEMDLMDSFDLKLIKKRFVLVLNKYVEAYTLGI